VLGAASDKETIERLRKLGIQFTRGEPGSGIVGASGLLLAFAQICKIPSACLMGETSGYFVDPASARALLKKLQDILGVKIDLSKLDEKASQIDKITSKLKELEKVEERSGADDLRYIG
jgi:proteasome assembly chaperone (PAC2) family protein